VSDSPIARLNIEKAQPELLRRIPTSVSLAWRTSNRIRNNRPRNLSFGLVEPTIFMYELKAGSQVFYGNLDLSVNLPDPRSLPVFEAVRLIENRMVEFLEKWSQQENRVSQAFSASKLILSCGDAILLKCGLYHYSYVERAKRFETRFKHDFATFFEEEFLNVYLKAVSYKLLPFAEWKEDDILGNLDGIYRACKSTLRILSNKKFQWPIELSDQQFEQLIKSLILPNSYNLKIFPNYSYKYENLISSIRCWRAKKKIYWEKIPPELKSLSLIQLLYGAIPHLFFGVSLNSNRNVNLLTQAAFWAAWMLENQHIDMAELEKELISKICSIWHVIS